MANPKSSPVRAPLSSQQLAKLLDEQQDSGQSIAAFARERGLSPWRLYHANRDRREATTDFVEVSVTTDSTSHPPLEVVLSDEITVRVPVGFDGPALKCLIGVLRSC